jgi:hypothetical protein
VVALSMGVCAWPSVLVMPGKWSVLGGGCTGLGCIPCKYLAAWAFQHLPCMVLLSNCHSIVHPIVVGKGGVGSWACGMPFQG